jgi:hypothetical protein
MSDFNSSTRYQTPISLDDDKKSGAPACIKRSASGAIVDNQTRQRASRVEAPGKPIAQIRAPHQFMQKEDS